MAEIGIAFQADKPPGRYGELATAAEAYGFDVVSVFADLLDQPPLPALLEMARATSRVRLGAAWPAAPGWRRSASSSATRWNTCATPRRSCARCCPATTPATPAPRTGWHPGSGCGIPRRPVCPRCCWPPGV